MTINQLNGHHEFHREGWWALRMMTATPEQAALRNEVWTRWANEVAADGTLTRWGVTPTQLQHLTLTKFLDAAMQPIQERIAAVFPNITADDPFRPWDAIINTFPREDLRVMVLWEQERWLYNTTGEMVPRQMQALRERYAYILRRHYGLPFVRIAALLGLRGESTARAYAQRFVTRTGAPVFTTGGGERRSNAGRTAAQRRWGGTRRTTQPVVVTKPKLGRTFGVEIEYSGAPMREVQAAIATALGVAHIHVFGYHGDTCRDCGMQVARSYTEWKIEHDSSVTRGTYPLAYGGEVVSPILRGTDGFDQITKVVKAIRDANGTITKKCGLHVHVDMKNLTATGRAKVLKSWQRWQPEITKIVARSRHNNHFCRQITAGEADYWVRHIQQGREQVGERYRTLNTTPFPRIGTYEFRLHQGTLNAKKIVAWVKFLIAFAEMAAADGDAETPVTLGIDRTNETIADLLDMLIKRHDDTNQEFGLRTPDANFIKRRVAQTTNTTN
jgi:hypothetical protein